MVRKRHLHLCVLKHSAAPSPKCFVVDHLILLVCISIGKMLSILNVAEYSILSKNSH